MLAIDESQKSCPFSSILDAYIEHQKKWLFAVLSFFIKEKQKYTFLVFLIALDHTDEVIRIIRASGAYEAQAELFKFPNVASLSFDMRLSSFDRIGT